MCRHKGEQHGGRGEEGEARGKREEVRRGGGGEGEREREDGREAVYLTNYVKYYGKFFFCVVVHGSQKLSQTLPDHHKKRWREGKPPQ